MQLSTITGMRFMQAVFDRDPAPIRFKQSAGKQHSAIIALYGDQNQLSGNIEVSRQLSFFGSWQ